MITKDVSAKSGVSPSAAPAAAVRIKKMKRLNASSGIASGMLCHSRELFGSFPLRKASTVGRNHTSAPTHSCHEVPMNAAEMNMNTASLSIADSAC